MKLYLMRHGEALHPAMDPQMHLSPRGTADVTRMGGHLRALSIRVDAVWHSPKQRAMQTAQLVAEALGFEAAHLNMYPDLEPEGDVESAKARIDALAQSGCQGLLIVSHMPFLPKLTLALAGPSGYTDFDTAQAAFFLFSKGLWTREWSQEPSRI